ncbi:uncharacterized protein STEHIDRAFT_69183 [Stereum hirsutum FP-91666 SS1]|uniref:Zn-finger domain-containing protein n=1 Tax=Stereum hirsutum (strain FP-91666) TaxID=721885 RepID=R7RWA0_STEHR|nr:uncharacterized protein STEHIDRAFT_69183 [Stereum hirsutum FP-91666 SS1]EIM79626.1 hypothetical protein STEHIDRAFT_69183 [Stereum hirsutum FP-91666 SS1]
MKATPERCSDDDFTFFDPPRMPTPTPLEPEAANGRPSSKRRRVEIEEVASDDTVFVETFPSESAGAWVEEKSGRTPFELHRDAQRAKGLPPWAPYDSLEDWELASWLIKSGVSQSRIDSFFKLRKIKDGANPSSHNKRSFFQKIDSLPSRPRWICDTFGVEGDLLDVEGEPMVEEAELWRRNPVDLVADLLGNPSFANDTHYRPEKIYTMKNGRRVRWFGEMWTTDWWWEGLISKIHPDATVAPVILASDKTALSTFSGDKEAWPVYLSVGGIDSHVRRAPSKRATLLLGYIPHLKLECFSESRRSVEGHRLFHECMRKMLEPLMEAGKNGIRMTCSDGGIRRVFPILAAYIADHPEQCLITCIKESRCPRCTVPADQRGSPVHSVLRDPEKTLKTLDEQRKGYKPRAFVDEGLQPVLPFWSDLPYCDIFSCITPDILHQLHKGVFKDHIVSWATAAMPGQADELDARYMSMPSHPSLRHFRRGISLVTQWTGNEYKNMQKVFLAAISGSSDPEVILTVRGVLDFIYYSHFEMHSDESLEEMDRAWQLFHAHKKVFIELGLRKHFNIPKIHSMKHYIPSIRSRGPAPGFNTEGSERLHIEYAKLGYRASNKKAYLRQMAKWLQRQEAVHRFECYLEWALPGYMAGSGEGDAEEESDEGNFSDTTVARRAVSESLMASTSSISAYKIARSAPLQVSVADLELNYGAEDFLRVLSRFLQQYGLRSLSSDISSRTCFPVFKRFYLWLPQIDEISPTRKKDTIRATPYIPRHKHTPAAPARFDPVLVWERVPSSHLPSQHPLSRLRVAQVRCIFSLPEEFGPFKTPLAYVQWFTPLREADPISGMHIVSRSTRQHQRFATVIPITEIARSCLLTPKPRQSHIPRTWTTDNVVEECETFFLNPYLRDDDFYFLRHLPALYKRRHL